MRLGRRSRPLLRLFGVRGVENAYAELGDDTLDARFGAAHVQVPLANISAWRIEGPWPWITAIGIRRSVRHADVSFAGSPRGGVRMDFKTPVKLGPLGTLVAQAEGVGENPYALAISPDGTRAVVANYSGTWVGWKAPDIVNVAGEPVADYV